METTAEQSALIRKILQITTEAKALRIAHQIAEPEIGYAALVDCDADVLRLVWKDVQMTPRKKPDSRLTPRQVRMGRTAVRDRGVLVRLTEDEQRRLEETAAEMGIPLATWVRNVALAMAATWKRESFGIRPPP